MQEKKIYLYKKLIMERQKKKEDQIDIFSLASHNQIQILMENNDKYFLSDEDAYFVIYQDKKSCIVIKNSLSYCDKIEWICYLILEILINKKFGLQENVECLKIGQIVKRYYFYQLGVNDLYFDILCELLVPSSKMSIQLYSKLNRKKIIKLANHFFVREEIILYKINQFYFKIRGLLDGITIKQNLILGK